MRTWSTGYHRLGPSELLKSKRWRETSGDPHKMLCAVGRTLLEDLDCGALMAITGVYHGMARKQSLPAAASNAKPLYDYLRRNALLGIAPSPFWSTPALLGPATQQSRNPRLDPSG